MCRRVGHTLSQEPPDIHVCANADPSMPCNKQPCVSKQRHTVNMTTVGDTQEANTTPDRQMYEGPACERMPGPPKPLSTTPPHRAEARCLLRRISQCACNYRVKSCQCEVQQLSCPRNAKLNDIATPAIMMGASRCVRFGHGVNPECGYEQRWAPGATYIDSEPVVAGALAYCRPWSRAGRTILGEALAHAPRPRTPREAEARRIQAIAEHAIRGT